MKRGEEEEELKGEDEKLRREVEELQREEEEEELKGEDEKL